MLHCKITVEEPNQILQAEYKEQNPSSLMLTLSTYFNYSTPFNTYEQGTH